MRQIDSGCLSKVRNVHFKSATRVACSTSNHLSIRCKCFSNPGPFNKALRDQRLLTTASHGTFESVTEGLVWRFAVRSRPSSSPPLPQVRRLILPPSSPYACRKSDWRVGRLFTSQGGILKTQNRKKRKLRQGGQDNNMPRKGVASERCSRREHRLLLRLRIIRRQSSTTCPVLDAYLVTLILFSFVPILPHSPLPAYSLFCTPPRRCG